MPQTTRQLEARLERVEKELAELKAVVAGKQGKPWYREIVGVFAGDKEFAEIVRLGRLIRQETQQPPHELPPPLRPGPAAAPDR